MTHEDLALGVLSSLEGWRFSQNVILMDHDATGLRASTYPWEIGVRGVAIPMTRRLKRAIIALKKQEEMRRLREKAIEHWGKDT